MSDRRRSVLDAFASVVAFVWLATIGRWSRSKGSSALGEPAVALPVVVDPRPVAQPRDVAQVQDHGAAPNATTRSSPDPVAFVIDDADGSTRPRLLVGPVIDGQTSWWMEAPPGGWGPVVRDMRTRLRQGATVLELPSPDGDRVEASIEYDEGAVVVWASSARIEIRGKRVEVQIEARAAWTEGPERWCARVLPLVSLWLLGAEFQGEPDWTIRIGASWLWIKALGWRQAEVQTAFDFVDWPFDADDHKAFVTKLLVDPQVQGGICHAINFGKPKNPIRGSLYAKSLLIAVLRGDLPAGYLERLREAGWDGVQLITRLELRARGKALLLLDESTGETLDYRDPWTACDREAVARIATHALQAVWMADLRRGRAAQTRDNPVHPGWQLARDAARGGAEPIRLSRAAIDAEHGSVRSRAGARLLRAGVDVGVLAGAEDLAAASSIALCELGRQLGDRSAAERFTASRARYRELLAAVREVVR